LPTDVVVAVAAPDPFGVAIEPGKPWQNVRSSAIRSGVGWKVIQERGRLARICIPTCIPCSSKTKSLIEPK
jgi:hypothetical protein